jgi:uncharacterized phage protein gp47/JayE
MADLAPNYFNEQTEETIRARMLGALSADLDKTEGSYTWDAIAPAAIELAQASLWAQEVLRRGFASTTFGEYLDLRCAEHGVTRRPAVKATGKIRLTGTANSEIPAGIIIATPADPNTNTPSIEFKTTSPVTLAADSQNNGVGIVNIEAVIAGKAGNVAGGSISILSAPVTGLSGVTNEAPTEGGLDIEEDASLLARFLQKVRLTPAGGNKADYINWAMEVPGVGAVSVIPIRDGPGTVSIAILNTNKEPAEQSLVDSVQTYIAPPHIVEKEAEDMATDGYGISVDYTQTDVSGYSTLMEYSSSGNGVLSCRLDTILSKLPGIWQARVYVKSSAITGTQDLLEVGLWNLMGTPDWCKTTATGNVNAQKILKGSDLSLTFAEQTVEFYWDGQDQIQFQATRLTSDTQTQVWVDKVVFRSTLSKDTGEGKAPVGATVIVEPAQVVTINISAKLDLMPGYNINNVADAVRENIRTYLKSLAFTADNDIRYNRIGEIILGTPGVRDHIELVINNDDSNIIIGEQEIAVMGDGDFTL